MSKYPAMVVEICFCDNTLDIYIYFFKWVSLCDIATIYVGLIELIVSFHGGNLTQVGQALKSASTAKAMGCFIIILYSFIIYERVCTLSVFACMKIFNMTTNNKFH